MKNINMRNKNIAQKIALNYLLPISLLISMAESSAATIDLDLSLQADELSPEATLILIQQDILDSLNNIPLADRTIEQSTLITMLTLVSTATTDEKSAFYGELSAKKNSTNSNVTRKSPGTISVSGISKRLSSLRNQINRSSFTQRILKSKNKGKLPLIFKQNNDDLAGGLLDQRLSGFVSGNYVISKQSETSSESGFDGSTQQLTTGADYRINNQTFAGLAINMMNGNMDITENGGTLKNKAGSLLAYGSYNIKPNWYVDGTVSSGVRFFEMNRTISFSLNNNATTVSTNACSKPDSKYIGLSLGTGYDKTFKNGHSLAALASFNYSVSNIDAFTESGCSNNAIPYSLVIGKQTITSKMLNIGGQWSQAISTNFGILLPQFSINWVNELENKSDTINAYFSNDPGQNTMSFKSGNKDLSFVNVKLAVSVVLPRGISGFIQYETQQFVDDYQQYTVSLGARKEF